MITIINKAFEIVNWLMPVALFLLSWLAIGMIAWIVALFLLHLEYNDFATGFHDGHEMIALGPIAMVFVVWTVIEQLKEKRMK